VSVDRPLLNTVDSPVCGCLSCFPTLSNVPLSSYSSQVQFDAQGFILGSFAIPYLLEKSRVCTAGQGERVYHSFYQVIKGRDKQTFLLRDDIRAYPSVVAGGTIDNASMEDAEGGDLSFVFGPVGCCCCCLPLVVVGSALLFLLLLLFRLSFASCCCCLPLLRMVSALLFPFFCSSSALLVGAALLFLLLLFLLFFFTSCCCFCSPFPLVFLVSALLLLLLLLPLLSPFFPPSS